MAGRTDAERDAQILKLWKSGWDYRKIAATVGMSKSGVHYAVQRLRGRPRLRPDPLDDWDESEWFAPE
jgi:DNA-directed RNA polymerase specialized sigma24 family protein